MTNSYSENFKKIPIKHKTVGFSRLQIFFSFYSKSKIVAVEQSFRDLLKEMYSEQLFLPTLNSLMRKPFEFINFIRNLVFPVYLVLTFYFYFYYFKISISYLHVEKNLFLYRL